MKANQNMKKGESEYLKLFDIYISMDEFDKGLVKLKADNAEIKQLAVLKMRLFEFVLSAIRPSYSTHRKIYEVRELMDYSEILNEKNLFDSSYKILLKAKKMAKKYDMLNEVVRANYKLKSLCELSNNLPVFKECLNEGHEESRNVLKKMKILEEYENMLFETKYSLIQNFTYGIEYDTEQVARIRRGLEVLDSVKDLGNPLVEIKFNQVWSFVHLAEGDYRASIDARKRAIDIMRYSLYKIEDNPLEWLYDQKMLMIALFNVGQNEEIEKEIEIFENTIDLLSFSGSNKRLASVVYSTIFMVKMNWFFKEKKYQEAEEYLSVIFDFFKDGFSKLNYNLEQVVVVNVVIAYVYNKNFKQALKWVNYLLNNRYGPVRMDLQVYVRLINMVIHYEIGNFDLIENLVESSSRFIKLNKHITEFEELFLGFAKRNMVFGQNPLAAKEFYEKIIVLDNRSHQDFFDFEQWVNAQFSD